MQRSSISAATLSFRASSTHTRISPSRAKGERQRWRRLAAFTRALAAGVKLAAGSDSPYTGAFTVVHELQAMVAHEMTPIQALVAATVAGAENLGLQDEIGSLSEGKKADLIAVRGNPLEDLSVLENVLLVMRNGDVLIDETSEP